jgi:mannose-6-phosphate isomerase-like protein (cupin superfamily)
LHPTNVLLIFALVEYKPYLQTKRTAKMKKIEKTAGGANFAAVTVGKMDELNQHTLILAPGVEIPGKVFTGSALGATGAEMSFQRIEPGAGVGFLHTHKTHEELYIIVRGEGEFQVDGKIFAVGEGSVIRVSPDGRRALRNTGAEPMIMICVQYKADSFASSDADDGVILDAGVVW